MADKEQTAHITGLPMDYSDLELIKPIDVEVRREGSGFIAKATDIPMLIEGVGKTREDAVSDLTIMVVDEFIGLDNEKYNITGAAQACYDKLQEYVKRKD